MAQLQITSQNARKYSVIGLILVTVVAGIAAIVIGTQLDRNLSGDDASAAVTAPCASLQNECSAVGLKQCVVSGGTQYRTCVDVPTACLDNNDNTTTITIRKYQNNQSCGANLICITGSASAGDSCGVNPVTTARNFAEACGSIGGVNYSCNSPFVCMADAVSGSGSKCWSMNLTNGSACINSVACTSNRCVNGTCQAASTGGGGGGSGSNSSSSSSTSDGGGGGGGGTQTATTTSTSTCSGTDRSNGCACVRDNQCVSGFCNTSTGLCARPSSCSGSNRPNGCQCGTDNDAVCASGNCQVNQGIYRCRPTTGCTGPTGRALGCFCNQNNTQCASGLCDSNTSTCITSGGGSGGGGTLPSTGIFDEDSRPLLIGLILLILGTVAYIATNSNKREALIAAKSSTNVYNDIDPDIIRIINSQKKK